MEFHKGQNRWVAVFPKAGVVVKFPIVYLKVVLEALTVDLWRFGWRGFKANWDTPMEAYGGFRSWLFKGLAANWMEFWLYVTTRNPFLQPTYFSLFGLVNVQRYGTPCPLKYVDVWCQLCELTNDQVWDDGHHFSNTQNFTFDGGVLRMLDYGSIKTRKVIRLYGEKIAQQFDPSYDWDEVCKRKANPSVTDRPE